MSETSTYWKAWWSAKARDCRSDYELNRQTAVRIAPLENESKRRLIANVAPTAADVVLDAGCGSGRNLALLSPLTQAVIGVDYSSEMVRRALSKVKECHLSNVQVLNASVTTLPFPDSAFDAVLCTSVLQYLDDMESAQAIRELFRVCRPGGRVLLHVKNQTSLYGMSLKVARILCRIIGHATKPEQYRPIGWYEREIKSSGGTVVGHDGFGVFTLAKLPRPVVRLLLRLEMRRGFPQMLKRFSVNYHITCTRQNTPDHGDPGSSF